MRLDKFFLLLLFPAVAQAQFKFDFIEDRTSETIATLELAQLSSNVEDVLSLSFKEAGQELFGFGPVYEGTFDGFFSPEDGSRFILDKDEFGVVGLGGEDAEFALGAGVFDLDPPASSLPGVDPNLFELNAIDAVVRGSFDSLSIRQIPLDTSVFTLGQWVLVPEPSGLLLCVGSLLAFGCLRCIMIGQQRR